MKRLHVVLGGVDNGDKKLLERAARNHLGTSAWTAPKSAAIGDDVVIYVRGLGFFATARIKSKPKPRSGWRNRYGARLTSIKLITPPISIGTIQRKIPALTWANYPRSITTPPPNVANQIRSLIRVRDLPDDAVADANTDEPRMPRFLFVKIGWMQNYAGEIPGDERPVGGGRYNRREIGSEIYNFLPLRRRYYGFFQPPANKINFERIDPATSNDGDKLRGVLVVMVAPKPGGGQVIVGWYRNATLLRTPVYHVSRKRRDSAYCMIAPQDTSVLVPPGLRDFPIPKKGGLGQRNVCYPFEANGTPKRSAWIGDALKYVDEFDGPNLTMNPEIAAEEESASAVEAALARAGGQGFARTPAERRAIEDYSMAVAKRYFKSNGFDVEDVHKSKPFDLRCLKGKGEVHVEVKGTTTTGAAIVLTKNEVGHASKRESKCILFVLHSIRLVKGKAKGGKRLLRKPWHPDADRLTPITYAYRL